MIKAIETVFDGFRFRSRLEARWATFLSRLEVSYEYEKEGYELPSARYLPDFWLPDVGMRSTTETVSGIWLEVKPEIPSTLETALCTELGEMTEKPVVIACGLPRSGIPNDDIPEFMFEVWPGWDNYMVFMKCHGCGRVKVEYGFESGYRICIACGGQCDNHHPAIAAAELAAKQARFEYGERTVS